MNTMFEYIKIAKMVHENINSIKLMCNYNSNNICNNAMIKNTMVNSATRIKASLMKNEEILNNVKILDLSCVGLGTTLNSNSISSYKAKAGISICIILSLYLFFLSNLK